MKKLLFTTFFITLIVQGIDGQVYLGPDLRGNGFSFAEVSDNALKRLKKTTTYFIYGKTDIRELKSWEKALKKSWKITSFKMMSFEEFALKKNHDGNSYLIKKDMSNRELNGFPKRGG